MGNYGSNMEIRGANVFRVRFSDTDRSNERIRARAIRRFSIVLRLNCYS